MGMRSGLELVSKLIINPVPDQFSSDKERYEWQVEARANYILIEDDTPVVATDKYELVKDIIDSNLVWLDKGELIAGSFLCNIVEHASPIQVSDVDIYFKCKDDAKLFLNKNTFLFTLDNFSKATVSVTAELGDIKLNLIFGINFDSPEDLITRFDIRACSIAYDPSKKTIYWVRGALSDCDKRRIIYNPIPHNTTISRLVKYIEKGFHIDPYQRLFLAELISSDMYNSDLEISTGYRAVYEDF
jgi:hypothetical protein